MFNLTHGKEDFLMCNLKLLPAVLAISACPSFYRHEELLDLCLWGLLYCLSRGNGKNNDRKLDAKLEIRRVTLKVS